MSCFGCSRKYGLFCKEYGCPNCGYSYCAKCLKRPMAVPRHNGKVLNVCLICYDKLTKMAEPEKVIDFDALPGTLVKKGDLSVKADGATLDDLLQETPPVELGGILEPLPKNAGEPLAGDGESAEITENLDCVISKRLQNLKTPAATSSDEDIRQRLSNLSGMPHKDYSNKKDILLSTDERTDQEKMHDLLQQFMGEANLDERVANDRNDAISEIERRLRQLRDAPIEGTSAQAAISPDTNTPSDNEQDDETVLKGIMEKYLAEARLPEEPSALESELASTVPPPPLGTKPGELEELPWCTVCNEDAVHRCKGCDGELFCAQCFREVHDDDEEYRSHKTVPYTAPPKFKEDHF